MEVDEDSEMEGGVSVIATSFINGFLSKLEDDMMKFSLSDEPAKSPIWPSKSTFDSVWPVSCMMILFLVFSEAEEDEEKEEEGEGDEREENVDEDGI